MAEGCLWKPPKLGANLSRHLRRLINHDERKFGLWLIVEAKACYH
jgi:hypothetical protein